MHCEVDFGEGFVRVVGVDLLVPGDGRGDHGPLPVRQVRLEPELVHAVRQVHLRDNSDLLSLLVKETGSQTPLFLNMFA